MSRLNTIILGLDYEAWSNYYRTAGMGHHNNGINTDLTFSLRTDAPNYYTIVVQTSVIKKLTEALDAQ